MRTGCYYLIILSVYVRLYVTFVVFTDCESCTRSISTYPGSMEVGEYGLTRGTCYVARRLELVAVAGVLWISWRVLDAAGFRVFFRLVLRTHTACKNMKSPCLIYLSNSNEAFFAFKACAYRFP